jgi:CubicO group peptidase (beta-lactamase class C family)
MANRNASIFWLSFVLIALGVTQTENVSAGQPQAVEIDKIFAQYNKPQTPGCSAGAIRDGKTLFSRGFGMADIEHDVSNTPSTVFHIASISKQFTAFAIHLLAEEKKLSLDDDIRKYLPELHDFGSTVTVRHLLHHISGLRDQWNLLSLAGWRLEDVITEQDILNMVARQEELNFRPGEQELYSNTGYTLLGIIVKRVSGMPLPQFAEERIFKPLNMTHSHIHDSYGKLVSNRAFSYVPLPLGAYRYIALSYSNVGATSLFTTVDDLLRWDHNFYDAAVGGTDVIAKMQTKGKLNNGMEIEYGSGLGHGEYRGAKTIEHGGSDAGFRSNLLRFPDLKFSVAVLCNAGDANPALLSRKIADLYLSDRLAAIPQNATPIEVKSDVKSFEPFVGDYDLAPGVLLSITVDKEQLMVQLTGQPKIALFASSDHEFFIKVVDAQLTFDPPNSAGKSMKVVLHQNGANLPAQRVELVTPTTQELKSYVGTYYSKELNVLYEVVLMNDKLVLKHPRADLYLVPMQARTFAAPYPIGSIEFECHSESCTGFRLNDGRVRNLRFDHVEIRPIK